MNISPSMLATWVVLASSGGWADNLRGTNSNHISHGQNDIRQLQGSDGGNVTIINNSENNVNNVIEGDGNGLNLTLGEFYPIVCPETPQCITKGGSCKFEETDKRWQWQCREGWAGAQNPAACYEYFECDDNCCDGLFCAFADGGTDGTCHEYLKCGFEGNPCYQNSDGSDSCCDDGNGLFCRLNNDNWTCRKNETGAPN